MSKGCYVYAIVDRDTPLPERSIESGATELVMVAWRRLAAVIRWMAIDDAPRRMADVLHHETVVESLRKQGRALPVRFGTVFRDATSLAAAIADRYESLEADLHRLGEKVEFGLMAIWTASHREGWPTAASFDGSNTGLDAGARYLHARAAEIRSGDAQRDRARAVASELDGRLGQFALDRRTSLLPSPRVAVRTAYLLALARVSAFQTAFEEVCDARRDFRVLLTGPWSPYSFVGPEKATQSDSPSTLTTLAQRLMDTIEAHAADEPRRVHGTSNHEHGGSDVDVQARR